MSSFLDICKTSALPVKILAGSAKTLISSFCLNLDKPQVLQLGFRQIKGKLYLSIFRRNESVHALTSMNTVLILNTLLGSLTYDGRTNVISYHFKMDAMKPEPHMI
jgi:hypothetical protein